MGWFPYVPGMTSKYAWSQPMCAECWVDRNPMQWPKARSDLHELEKCCACGHPTRSGIYTWVDPESVPYPTFMDEEDDGEQ